MEQFQNHIKEQPALIDISSEEIVQWDTKKKEKIIVTQENFEREAQLNGIDANLATAEIFQVSYLEICDVVYCLSSRGLPVKFL